MVKAYSSDIRSRVVSHVETGNSRRDAARRFGVSESFAVKLLQRFTVDGSLAPKPMGRPRGQRFDALESYLVGIVEEKPDITMPELAARLMDDHKMKAAPAELSRFLCRLGFSYKKTAAGIGMRTR